MFGSKVDKRYLVITRKHSIQPLPSIHHPQLCQRRRTWPEDPNANETQNPLGRLTIKDQESSSYINANARITWTVIDGLKLSAFGIYRQCEGKLQRLPEQHQGEYGNQWSCRKEDNKSGVLLVKLLPTTRRLSESTTSTYWDWLNYKITLYRL